MGWIDYQKAYYMVSHSWITEMLKMVKVVDNMSGRLCGSIDDSKTVLTSNNKVLVAVGIKQGIFQGDLQSTLLLALTMFLFAILSRRENLGQRLVLICKLLTVYCLQMI